MRSRNKLQKLLNSLWIRVMPFSHILGSVDYPSPPLTSTLTLPLKSMWKNVKPRKFKVKVEAENIGPDLINPMQ